MTNIRPGYYSEKNKKESYLLYIEHTDEIKALHRKICDALEKEPLANFELANICEVKETTICGRVNELKKAGFVIAHPKELKHKNPETNFNCITWVLTNKYNQLSGDVQTAMNF